MIVPKQFCIMMIAQDLLDIVRFLADTKALNADAKMLYEQRLRECSALAGSVSSKVASSFVLRDPAHSAMGNIGFVFKIPPPRVALLDEDIVQVG